METISEVTDSSRLSVALLCTYTNALKNSEKGEQLKNLQGLCALLVSGTEFFASESKKKIFFDSRLFFSILSFCVVEFAIEVGIY